MNMIGERLRQMRESVGLSQMKIAGLVGTTQASINRYEAGQATPPTKVFLWYADYFDVSLDYIYGRTDSPQGKLYEHKPTLRQSDPELARFIEMCFDSKSPMNERLKETLVKILKEAES